MRIPQTTEMNDAFDNFVGFIEAWLCDPYCDANDLLWDYDDSNDINLIDWAAAVDANDFFGAFATNGRYILTDFRNSVIGKVNLDGSVDEIFYNAWGIPSVAQGADLEGLSILWNGYYFDSETANYYLRNRYYSPLERKFITDDPYGINPDGNWNNRPNILGQYQDGYGLMVYAQGDPVNGWDGWGLASYALGNYDYTPAHDVGSGTHGALAPATKKDKLAKGLWYGVALGARVRGYDDASKHMNHYLGNSGSTYSIDYGGLIGEVKNAQIARDTEINSAIAFAESVKTKKSFYISSYSATGSYAIKSQSKNWYYAVGGYSTWGKGGVKTNGCKYKMEFTLKFGDRYNWDAGKSVTIFGKKIPDISLGRLHQVGISQEFDMVGDVKYTVEWKKGERIGTGAMVKGGR